MKLPSILFVFCIFLAWQNPLTSASDSETLLGHANLVRVKRGVWEGQPEYNYIKAAFAALDAQRGLTNKKKSYENLFTKFVKDTRTKLGSKYKGQLDWNDFSAWRYKSYGAATKALNKNLESAFKSPKSRSEAVKAMKLIEDVVNERERQMNKYPTPDPGHITVYNKWRDQWADWFAKYGKIGFLSPPPPRKSMPSATTSTTTAKP